MPKLTPQTKKIRNQEFLTALKATGSPKEAAKIVGKIGSQGSKNIENSAAVMGTKRLKQVNLSILDAALKNGITPDKVAKKINNLLDAKKIVRQFKKGDLEYEYEEDNVKALDKGIEHSLKIGVGGGYAPEKHIVGTISLNKLLDEANKPQS